MVISFKIIVYWVIRVGLCVMAYYFINVFCRTYEIELLKRKDRIDGVITSKLLGYWFVKQTHLTNIQSAQLNLVERGSEDDIEHYEVNIVCNEGNIKTTQMRSQNHQQVDELNRAIKRLNRVGQKTTVPLSPPDKKMILFIEFFVTILLMLFFIIYTPEFLAA